MRLDLETWRKRGCPPVQIRLDGDLISNVVMADEEEGVVEIARMDLYQFPMEECPTETLHGEVQIHMGVFQ